MSNIPFIGLVCSMVLVFIGQPVWGVLLLVISIVSMLAEAVSNRDFDFMDDEERKRKKQYRDAMKMGDGINANANVDESTSPSSTSDIVRITIRDTDKAFKIMDKTFKKKPVADAYKNMTKDDNESGTVKRYEI